MICDPATIPAEADAPDANRAGSDAHLPGWVVQLLARLILCLIESWLGAGLRRASRLPSWLQERPDLPAGSTQAEAVSVRGQFGNAIAWMCRRRGIGPGHPDWPELSRAIVAFGGSVAGFRAGLPACGLQWWENPNVVPGMITTFSAPAASLPQQQAVADIPPRAPSAVQAEAAPARLPAPWLSVSGWRVFARAGPGPATGPPRRPVLPTLSCLMNGAGARSAPPS